MGNFVLDSLVALPSFRRTISLPRKGEGLHVMPTSTGCEQVTAPGYDWHGLKRGQTPFTILQHTIAGRGHLTYERRSFQLTAGDTMLVTIPHQHRYWVEDGDNWSFFWIAMCGQEAFRLQRSVLSASGPVFRLQSSSVDRLAEICHVLSSPQLQPGKASGLAYDAIMLLHDELLARPEGHGEADRNLVIARVTAFIRRNLDQALDVKTLADHASMSRAHFTRQFTRVIGQSPSEFVQQERMQLATRLLIKGQLGVKAIAHSCGFHDPNYFAKVFHRTFAITPSDFRTTGMYAAASTRASLPAGLSSDGDRAPD